MDKLARYTTAIPQTHLSKTEILEKLGAEKQVEQWVENIKKTNIRKNALADLVQDTYLLLLEMDDEKLETLYEKGELPFFVNRVLLNQINSTTSAYYYKYIKPQIHDEIPEDI